VAELVGFCIPIHAHWCLPDEPVTKIYIVVPYVKGLSEAFARILKSHGITTANHAHRTLRNFVVHPKDKVKDEEKTELMYRVPCKNCSSSYVGETGRKFDLRIKEQKIEVDSFTAGTQT